MSALKEGSAVTYAEGKGDIMRDEKKGVSMKLFCPLSRNTDTRSFSSLRIRAAAKLSRQIPRPSAEALGEPSRLSGSASGYEADKTLLCPPQQLRTSTVQQPKFAKAWSCSAQAPQSSNIAARSLHCLGKLESPMSPILMPANP